jgi:chemotaxis protein methyltransferase CheR
MLQRDMTVSPREEQAFEQIRSWLHTSCGFFYEDKKHDLLMSRLLRVCELQKVDNLLSLWSLLPLDTSHELRLAVIHACSTNHTYFFREPVVLDFFCDTILPTLPSKEVRIWSAAASSGDEAYTIAMLAAEKRGRVWANNNLAILGTDISEPIIKQAEAGIYGASHLEQTTPDMLARYFESAGINQYRVSPDIRNMCLFRRMNLTSTPYAFRKTFHVIFCRNVLYYFDKPTQAKVLNALYQVAAPGTWLLTSVTVSIRDLNTPWVSIASGIYQKQQS